MKELQKTLIFVAVALLLTGAAFVRIPDRTSTSELFNDQGKPFFPDFKDPLACTDLEVIDYDPSTASVSPFKVMLQNGKWVIPSYHNYPADAKDRLAKTAAGVIGLTKDTIRSDRVDDWEEMGVIAPDDEKTTTLKGRGKRVTLRDVSGKVLADFIIGNEVRDRSGQRYVRVPGEKRTYGVNVKVDLSTKFADWIETNLLKIDTFKIRRVTFDGTKVDLERRAIVPGELVTIDRKDSSAPWTLQGGIPAEQELNSDKLSTLTTALGDLKIVGVRPKPDFLSRELKVNNEKDIDYTRPALISLQSKGFYPSTDGRMLSNQGDVKVATEEGVVYTLRFGEVVFATGRELAAGAEEAAKEKEKGKDKKSEGTTEGRYLMVTVSFDPTFVPPPRSTKSEPTDNFPDDIFAPDPNDPKWIEQQKAAKEKAEREKADYERRVADGKKRVEELMSRFAGWYYVTPGESFRSIALDRAALLRPKSAAKPENPKTSPPGLPNF
jgi:uncharacterized protein DUF4340